jgi:hypothetical protein
MDNVLAKTKTLIFKRKTRCGKHAESKSKQKDVTELCYAENGKKCYIERSS